MPSNPHLRRSKIVVLALLSLGTISILGAAAIPALADQDVEQREVTVERPVVVVRTGKPDPGVTWSVEGHRSFLGVQTLALTTELREHFGVPREAGVLVAKIVEESPAAVSGLQIGDIISGVDGEEILSPSSLAMAIRHRESGDVVDLEVWRDGQVLSLTSTLTQHEGPWVDIRQFHIPKEGVQRWEWSSDELDGAIELEAETLNMAIERLNRELDSPAWHERVHVFREHQGTLLKRIETLERQLEHLEAELENLSRDD